MNIGFIGAGYMAHEHAKVFEFLGCNVAAIASRNSEVSSERFSGNFKSARRYIDKFELIEKANIDALIITTPPEVTETLLDSINQRGLFSLVEKPGALNLESLERIINNPRIFFGYNRRFYESVAALKMKVDKNDGYFQFHLVEPCFDNVNERRDCLLNNSVHMFDLIQFFIPNCELHYLSGDYLRYLFDIRDENKKSRGTLKVSFGAFRNQSIHWDGDKSSITLEPIEEFHFTNAFHTIEPSDLNPIRRYIPTVKDESENNLIISDCVFKPGLLNQAREFLAQCISKDEDCVNVLSKPKHAHWVLAATREVQKNLL